MVEMTNTPAVKRWFFKGTGDVFTIHEEDVANVAKTFGLSPNQTWTDPPKLLASLATISSTSEMVLPLEINSTLACSRFQNWPHQ